MGDTTVYNTNIMESVSCQSFAGSITTQLSSFPDSSLKSVNLTTISGYIHADINDYNQLYVASESGYIEVNANPKLDSTSHLQSNVGNMNILVVIFY